MSEVPRPDQRAISVPGGAPGSRSGAGDLAGALSYPGVASVPNCTTAEATQQVTGVAQFFTFSQPGRIWQVVLSYVVTSNGSFSLATSRVYARVLLKPANITLAIINRGVAGPNQHAEGQSEPHFPGLQVPSGQSLAVDVNNGVLVPNMDQQASAVVLYSVP